MNDTRILLAAVFVFMAIFFAFNTYGADIEETWINIDDEGNVRVLAETYNVMQIPGDRLATIRARLSLGEKSSYFLAGIRESTCEKGFGQIALARVQDGEVMTWDYTHGERKVKSLLGDELCLAIPEFDKKLGRLAM
jgi:hypothetical protein